MLYNFEVYGERQLPVSKGDVVYAVPDLDGSPPDEEGWTYCMHDGANGFQHRGYVPDTFILHLAPDKRDRPDKFYSIQLLPLPGPRFSDVSANEHLFKTKGAGPAASREEGSDGWLLANLGGCDDVRVKEELLRRGLDVKGTADQLRRRLRGGLRDIDFDVGETVDYESPRGHRYQAMIVVDEEDGGGGAGVGPEESSAEAAVAGAADGSLEDGRGKGGGGDGDDGNRRRRRGKRGGGRATNYRALYPTGDWNLKFPGYNFDSFVLLRQRGLGVAAALHRHLERQAGAPATPRGSHNKSLADLEPSAVGAQQALISSFPGGGSSSIRGGLAGGLGKGLAGGLGGSLSSGGGSRGGYPAAAPRFHNGHGGMPGVVPPGFAPPGDGPGIVGALGAGAYPIRGVGVPARGGVHPGQQVGLGAPPPLLPGQQLSQASLGSWNSGHDRRRGSDGPFGAVSGGGGGAGNAFGRPWSAGAPLRAARQIGGSEGPLWGGAGRSVESSAEGPLSAFGADDAGWGPDPAPPHASAASSGGAKAKAASAYPRGIVLASDRPAAAAAAATTSPAMLGSPGRGGGYFYAVPDHSLAGASYTAGRAASSPGTNARRVREGGETLEAVFGVGGQRDGDPPRRALPQSFWVFGAQMQAPQRVEAEPPPFRDPHRSAPGKDRVQQQQQQQQQQQSSESSASGPDGNALDRSHFVVPGASLEFDASDDGLGAEPGAVLLPPKPRSAMLPGEAGALDDPLGSGFGGGLGGPDSVHGGGGGAAARARQLAAMSTARVDPRPRPKPELVGLFPWRQDDWEAKERLQADAQRAFVADRVVALHGPDAQALHGLAPLEADPGGWKQQQQQQQERPSTAPVGRGGSRAAQDSAAALRREAAGVSLRHGSSVRVPGQATKWAAAAQSLGSGGRRKGGGGGGARGGSSAHGGRSRAHGGSGSGAPAKNDDDPFGAGPLTNHGGELSAQARASAARADRFVKRGAQPSPSLVLSVSLASSSQVLGGASGGGPLNAQRPGTAPARGRRQPPSLERASALVPGLVPGLVHAHASAPPSASGARHASLGAMSWMAPETPDKADLLRLSQSAAIATQSSLGAATARLPSGSAPGGSCPYRRPLASPKPSPKPYVPVRVPFFPTDGLEQGSVESLGSDAFAPVT